MINVNSQLKSFLKFLNLSRGVLDELMENHDWNDDAEFIFDWMAVNWELLVQREILGEYASMPPVFSQQLILNSQIKPTHNLIVKLRDNPEATFALTGFVSKAESGVYHYMPPFDVADLCDIAVQNKTWRPPTYYPVAELDFFIMDYAESLSLI
jgi:hypothetical protein